MTMKKVIFATAFVAMSGLALACGIGTFRDQEAKATLQLANAEVLAGNEGGSTSWDCWYYGKPGGAGFWRCGNPCIWIQGYTPEGSPGTCLP